MTTVNSILTDVEIFLGAWNMQSPPYMLAATSLIVYVKAWEVFMLVIVNMCDGNDRSDRDGAVPADYFTVIYINLEQLPFWL